MRARRLRALAVAAPVAVASGLLFACAGLYDLDRTVAETGRGDAAPSSDSGSALAEASAPPPGRAPRWCDDAGSPTFCDDFDAPDAALGATWTEVRLGNFDAGFLSRVAQSPPNAFLLALPATTTFDYEAFLRYAASPTTGLTLDFDLNIVALSSAGDHNTYVVSIRQERVIPEASTISLHLTPTTSGLQEQIVDDASANTFADSQLGPAFPTGWQHVQIDLTVGDTPQATLTLGDSAAPFFTTTLPLTTPFAVATTFVELGSFFVGAGSTQQTLYDNVVVRVR